LYEYITNTNFMILCCVYGEADTTHSETLQSIILQQTFAWFEKMFIYVATALKLVWGAAPKMLSAYRSVTS